MKVTGPYVRELYKVLCYFRQSQRTTERLTLVLSYVQDLMLMPQKREMEIRYGSDGFEDEQDN